MLFTDLGYAYDKDKLFNENYKNLDAILQKLGGWPPPKDEKLKGQHEEYCRILGKLKGASAGDATTMYREALLNGRADLMWFFDSTIGWSAFVSDAIKSAPKEYENLYNSLMAKGDAGILGFMGEVLIPNVSEAAFAEGCESLLSRGDIKELKSFMELFKKKFPRPLLDRGHIMEAYPKLSTESVFNLFDITGVIPPEADAHRAYGLLMSEGHLNHLEKIRKAWGIKPAFNNDDVQKRYQETINGKRWRDDRLSDLIKRLKGVTGIDPEESLIRENYEVMLASSDWGGLTELKEATGVPIPIDRKEAKRQLIVYLDRIVWDKTISGDDKRFIKLCLGLLSKDDIQKEYTACFKTRKFKNLCAMENLKELTGIRPDLDENTMQKEFSLYLSQGWIDGLAKLKSLTGMEPRFSGHEMRTAFLRMLHTRELENISTLMRTVKGASPDPDDVQEEYRRYLFDQDFSRISPLQEACGIKPHFKREEVLDALGNLTNERRFRAVGELLKNTGFVLERPDLDAVLVGAGIDQALVNKIDNDMVQLVFENLSSNGLKPHSLNKLLCIGEKEPVVLYSEERAGNDPSISYGQKLGALVLGLVTRDRKTLEKTYALFGKKEIDYIRAHIKRNAVFQHTVRRRIAGLVAGDKTAAEDAYHAIHGEYFTGRKDDELRNIYDSIEGGNDGATVKKIEVRTWRRGIEDIFDSKKTQACVFYPASGGMKGDVLDYAQNPDMELIDMYFNDEKFKTATSICYKTEDKNGNKVLLVDSVEAGQEVVKMGRNRWIDVMMGSIRKYAVDGGFDYIMVNCHVTEGKATDFKKRVRTDHPTGVELVIKPGPYVYLESFKRENNCHLDKSDIITVDGYVLDAKPGIDVAYRAGYGVVDRDRV